MQCKWILLDTVQIWKNCSKVCDFQIFLSRRIYAVKPIESVIFVVMQISIFYQRQHHLERNATEEQLLCLQSFGVLVYRMYHYICVTVTDPMIQRILLINLERETTIYAMHCVKGGLYVVDIITNFTIPDNKDQVYVIDEILEKVYFFKV